MIFETWVYGFVRLGPLQRLAFIWRGVLLAAWVTCQGCGSRVFAPRPIAPQEHVFMAIVGDSIAGGFTAGRADATVVHQLASLRPAWFIANDSAGGASMGPYAARSGLSATAILPLWPQAVVIMLGTNDCGFAVPLPTFRQRYEEFVDLLLKYYQPVVVCVTPLRQLNETAANQAGYTMPQYRDAIREVCGSRGLGVIDGRRLLPFEPRYFADPWRVHPNAEGYALFARNLAEELDQYMPARSP